MRRYERFIASGWDGETLRPDHDADQLALTLTNTTDRAYLLTNWRFEGDGLYSGHPLTPPVALNPESRRTLRLPVPHFRDRVVWLHGKRTDLNRSPSRCVFTLVFDCAPATDWTIRAPTKSSRSSKPNPISMSRKYAEIVSTYEAYETELWPVTMSGDTEWKHFAIVHAEKAALRIGAFMRFNQSAKQFCEYRIKDKAAKWHDCE